MTTADGTGTPGGEGVSVKRMTKQVGRALVRAAGPDWTHIRAEYRSAGRHIEVDLIIAGADGAPRLVRPPAEVVEGLGRIRRAMYRPGEGTWLSAIYEISPDGSYTWECEPNLEPVWRRVPPPIGFQDELREHPRDEANTPDWLRARAGLPPRPVEPVPDTPTPPRPMSAQTPGPGPAPHQAGARRPTAPPPPGTPPPGFPPPAPGTPPSGFPPRPAGPRHRGRTPIPPRRGPEPWGPPAQGRQA
ncbi:hypothetical protein [Actinokineospora pegani]|uniref:hypothetical protein n=1 Tax=Actinokineospora pegani TaxID=2654637 RepID=UPI0012EAAE64|nr:hypothetical protein [Actinokineospora pegani]